MIKNILWFALCIYYESCNQPREGQIAVGHVIMNRVERRDASIKDIVKAPRQFSWLNPGMKRPPLDNFEALETCFQSAIDCLGERLEGKDFFGCDHYHADYIDFPDWSKKMKFVKQVGAHLFYRS